MAGNLNKTKHRIASINSTKKITKAMELNTPIGVKCITTEMIFMEMSLMDSASFTKGCAFSPIDRHLIPIRIANTST